MKKLHYVVFFLLATCILSWVLPWLYSLCFTEHDREPFVCYSPICDRLVVTDFSAEGDEKDEPYIYEVDPLTKKAVNSYTMDQRDSLLPEIFVGQLSAKGQLPDSIKGVEITMRDIRFNSWIFTSSPKNFNRSIPSVYPLMESMPARFRFEDPTVVLTMDGHVEITDIESNTVDAVKTGRFAKMFADKGFTFPCREAAGNVTTRKAYDNGYLIIDGNDRLYHLKMQAGRPSMARIALADTIVPRHAFVLENADRKLYGLFTDRDHNLYAINHDDTYSVVKLPEVRFNPETDRITIMKNLFSWCIKVSSGDVTEWVALDPDDYTVLADYSYTAPVSVSTKVRGWIFPFTTEFTSSDDKYVYPRVGNWSWHALFLNLLLTLVVVVTFKGRTRFPKALVTLLCGLFSFIPLLLLNRVFR